jgi:hypothetical protein
MKEWQAYSIISTLMVIGIIIILATQFFNQGVIVTMSGVFVFFYHIFSIVSEKQ